MKISDVEMVTIPKSLYEDMKKDMYWRIAMENAGVDNWDWFDVAMEAYIERVDDENL